MQAATIRLIDKRQSYTTRLVTVTDRVISNVLVLDRELNIGQQESYPFTTSTRTSRAFREVPTDAQQRKAPRVQALRRRQ